MPSILPSPDLHCPVLSSVSLYRGMFPSRTRRATIFTSSRKAPCGASWFSLRARKKSKFGRRTSAERALGNSPSCTTIPGQRRERYEIYQRFAVLSIDLIGALAVRKCRSSCVFGIWRAERIPVSRSSITCGSASAARVVWLDYRNQAHRFERLEQVSFGVSRHH